MLARTHEEGFYRNQVLRAATFDEIHKLEQYLGLVDGLRQALDGLLARPEGGPLKIGEAAALEDHVASLVAELDYIKQVAQCRDARDLGDALVVLRSVETKGAGQSGVEQLARMYLAFAGRRRLTAEIVAERFEAGHDLAYDLGIGSRIKDFCSGRTTVRIAQVFKGHLDLLSPHEPAG